jgi:hypothetical protein
MWTANQKGSECTFRAFFDALLALKKKWLPNPQKLLNQSLPSASFCVIGCRLYWFHRRLCPKCSQLWNSYSSLKKNEPDFAFVKLPNLVKADKSLDECH